MRYTETVYRINDGDMLCRIIDNIHIQQDGDSLKEGILVTNTDGIKVGYTKDFFDKNFYVFDVGESPSAIMQKDENKNLS